MAAVAELRTAHTADLDPATVRAARGLLDEAFHGEATEADWEHALGGVHALVWDGPVLIGHGSVIQRRLLHQGRALRAGYVEAVAVHPGRQGEGHGAALMGALEQVLRGAYDLGALGSTEEGAGFYAARGWQVLPVHTPIAEGCSCGQDCGASAGKHPRTLHGFKEASRHPDRIWHWWRRWPDANIGIRTGQESRLVVMEVDGRHGGEESLEILEATYDRLPPTLTAQSGSGGRHLYFLHPGQRITNSEQLAGFAGLDVRGDGGYIVAPPSLHRSGQRYAWVDATHPLAALPLWLRELFAPPEQPQRNVTPVKRLGPPGATEAYWLRRALERARPGTRGTSNTATRSGAGSGGSASTSFRSCGTSCAAT